jgi:NaMN:DMB phosphoribosyltransferase
MEEQPITPHAVPVFDAEGNLTYIGDDGRRYVVGPLPELDAAHVDQVMQRLLAGQALFADLEELAEQWLAQVCGPDLSRAAALSLLLSSLEMALGPAEEPSAD